MNRVLKILSLAVVLFLAYMWISILYDSCNKNKSVFNDFENNNVEVNKEVPSISEEMKDEPFFAEEEEGVAADNAGEKDTDNTTPIDYDAIDQKIYSDDNGSEVTNTTPSKQVYSGSGGKYLVIAGNYLLEDNATTMVIKLNKLGYDKAEKVIFDLSQFHSVCAGRFDDKSAAITLSEELKRRGIDSYVHTKK